MIRGFAHMVLSISLATTCLASCKGPKAASEPQKSVGFSVVEQTPAYEFSYVVPEDVASLPGLASELRQDAEKQRAEFVAFANEVAKNKESMGGPEHGNFFEASWRRVAAIGSLVSLEFNVARYDGGAHPLTAMDSRLIDAQSGKVIQLADLLQRPVAESRLPEALCAEIRKVKADVYGEPVTCSGEKPTVKLDGPFVLLPSVDVGKAAGLRFLFSPYDIGPYVEGPHLIDVPFDAFRDDLKPVYAVHFGGAVAPTQDPPVTP